MRCLLPVLALCLFAQCSAPGAVGPSGVGTVDTCVFPAHFVDQIDSETELNDLEALPHQIQTRLRQYILHRLGSDFSSRLRFRSATFMDPVKVPQVVQAEQRLGRMYVAYVILFDVPLTDGSTYCAGLHMTADGDVVMEIGLPMIATFPSKAHVLTQSEAEVVAARHGLSDPNHGPLTRLQYAPSRDALVWEIAEVSSSTEGKTMVTTCLIDAHSGSFLGWSSGEILF